MKRLLTLLTLIGLIGGLLGLSHADPIPITGSWFGSLWRGSYANEADSRGSDLDGAIWHEMVRMGPAGDTRVDATLMAPWNLSSGSSSPMCRVDPYVCMPEGTLDPMIMLAGPVTLIGHLTLDEYTSLAELPYVTEMYISGQGTLTVKFFGGAWPGSLLSIFQTSFLL